MFTMSDELLGEEIAEPVFFFGESQSRHTIPTKSLSFV